jgi:hypothetical protein
VRADYPGFSQDECCRYTWHYGNTGEDCDIVCSRQDLNCQAGNWGVHSEEQLSSVMAELGLDSDMCERHTPESGRHVDESRAEGSPHIRTSEWALTNYGGGCWWKPSDTHSTCEGTWDHGSRLCKCSS